MRRGSTVSRPGRHTRRGAARSGRSSRLLALVLTLLAALAVLAPTGQASESATHAAERDARQALHQAEKDALRLQREAERSSRKAERKLAREPERLAHLEKLGNIVTIGCTSVEIHYNGFPEAAGNSSNVSLKLKPEGSETARSWQALEFEFDGSSAVQTLPIMAPQGRSMIDVHAKWHSNGYNGNFDIHGPTPKCAPEPLFTVEKLQAIEGETLSREAAVGTVGQTVTYEVIATNTGNTVLTFGNFKDEHCDEGTIAITKEGETEPGQQTVFTCTHKLTAEDAKAESLTNIATVTGKPEEGEGEPKVGESNPVVVIVKPTGEPSVTPETKTEPATEPPAKSEVLSSSSSSTGTPGKSGVLAFASTTVPALHGPQGCVRSAFTASMHSAGVASATFYLDAHKLRTLTYKNARKGLLTLTIDGSKLKIGAHKLMAKVTMKATSPTAKAAKASRSLMIVRCKSAVLTPRFTG